MRAFGCRFSPISAGPDGERAIGRERKGRAAELHRIDAQQQVMHDRVADQRHLENVLRR